MLQPRPTSKMEDHPLPAVRDCLFNIFAATLHIGGRSSICNLRTRHAVATGTHLPRGSQWNMLFLNMSAIQVLTMPSITYVETKENAVTGCQMKMSFLPCLHFLLSYFPFYLFLCDCWLFSSILSPWFCTPNVVNTWKIDCLQTPHAVCCHHWCHQNKIYRRQIC